MITRITAVDDDLVTAFARLMPQLSKSPPPSHEQLATLVAQECCRLLAYRDDTSPSTDAGPGASSGPILGVLTLTLYRIPTGFQARIDDVIVDEAARGRGIGEALSRAAIELAREAGAKNVTLTSRPARAAANRLYERLGFIRVETNVYRYPLLPPA